MSIKSQQKLTLSLNVKEKNDNIKMRNLNAELGITDEYREKHRLHEQIKDISQHFTSQ